MISDEQLVIDRPQLDTYAKNVCASVMSAIMKVAELEMFLENNAAFMDTDEYYKKSDLTNRLKEKLSDCSILAEVLYAEEDD